MYSADPFEEVRKELADGHTDEALWLRCFAESGGSQDRAVALYYRYRAEMFATFYRFEQAEIQRVTKAEAKAAAKQAAEARAIAARQMAQRHRAEWWENYGGIVILVGIIAVVLFFCALLPSH